MRIYVVVSPELEKTLLEELRDILCNNKLSWSKFKREYNVIILEGGIELDVEEHQLWAIHLYCRIADTVRVRIPFKDSRGKPKYRFNSKYFNYLKSNLKQIDWTPYISRPSVISSLSSPFLTSVDSKHVKPILERAQERSEWLPNVSAVCSHSKLYHNGAVEERAQKAIAKSLDYQRNPFNSYKNGKQPWNTKIFLHIENDECCASVDATGNTPMFKRGYRSHVTSAPIRENLAAACLRTIARDINDHSSSIETQNHSDIQDHDIDWDKSNHNTYGNNNSCHTNQHDPENTDGTFSTKYRELRDWKKALQNITFWDPMCGSGTLILEALSIASGIPAIPPSADSTDETSMLRDFQFQHWPSFNASKFNDWMKHHRQEESSLISTEHQQGEFLYQLGQNYTRGNFCYETRPPLFVGTDIDSKAISAARSNAERALKHCFSDSQWAKISNSMFFNSNISNLENKIPKNSVIFTNPPYGKRMENVTAVQKFQSLLQRRKDITHAYMLMPSKIRLPKHLHNMFPKSLGKFRHGGSTVKLYRLVR